MLDYELSQILHTAGPIIVGSLAGAICVIIGILVANLFWKARIYRFANATILKTLEYQSNKIEQQEEIIKDKNLIISDQRGSLKVAKIAALRIVGVVK